MLAATEPQVIRQPRDRVTDGGRSPIKTRRLRLIELPVPQETTSPTATLTPLRMDPPPPPHPPTHHTPVTTPTVPPTLHQHRHQQWQNALTHATCAGRVLCPRALTQHSFGGGGQGHAGAVVAPLCRGCVVPGAPGPDGEAGGPYSEPTRMWARASTLPVRGTSCPAAPRLRKGTAATVVRGTTGQRPHSLTAKVARVV